MRQYFDSPRCLQYKMDPDTLDNHEATSQAPNESSDEITTVDNCYIWERSITGNNDEIESSEKVGATQLLSQESESDLYLQLSSENEFLCGSVKEAIGAKVVKYGTENKMEKRIASVNFDEKINKMEQSDSEVTELLGSVTTHNCPGTRASARVIQKMKQDQIRPLTPPHSEREQQKKEEKMSQKTPSHVRANKPIWTNVERNHFFDALNEFGKDFEAIGNYINSKLKRKSATDVSFKSKDQVRQHYYQTYHKICKYIKFTDEIKKPVQELYALINYGEMRRRLQFVTDKHFLKLRNLVYQGYITLRCKGKNIRVKTPSCKALRKLNQVNDTLEDLRLPTKIDVILSPANMESFGRVQTLAQNPRARITVPLQKKLANLIKAFQYKWRSPEIKLVEEEAKLYFPTATTLPTDSSGQISDMQEKSTFCGSYQDAEMWFQPRPCIAIHRPLLSITEYLSGVNICLNSYEERMGVKMRSETLGQERCSSKRLRTDSGSEKRSPEVKKVKQICGILGEKSEIGSIESIVSKSDDPILPSESEITQQKSESSGDELSDEINDLLSDTDMLIKEEFSSLDKLENHMTNNLATGNALAQSSIVQSHHVRSKRVSQTKGTRPLHTFKPLLNEQAIKSIRKGWTVSNAADITIGDLYVVMGQDSKLELEYYWRDAPLSSNISTAATASATTAGTINDPVAIGTIETAAIFKQKQNGIPYNPNECDDPKLIKTLSTSCLGNKLKHLLLIANLSERIRKRQCSCGHSCDRIATKTRIERDVAAKTFVSTKSFTASTWSEGGSSPFRQPVVPNRRPIHSIDPVKQLHVLPRQRMSRQVLVQRLLLPSGTNQSYDVLDVKNLENTLMRSNELKSSELEKEILNTSIPSLDTKSSVNTTLGGNTISKNETNSVVCSSRIAESFSRSTETDSLSQLVDDVLDAFSKNSSNSKCPYNGYISDKKEQTNIEEVKSATNTDDNVELSLPAPSGSTFDESSSSGFFAGMSPMHLLRDSTSNPRWLEENFNDFSLTSLLGHLDDITGSRDNLDPSSNISVISESSVDYRHKFQEITALMQSQDKD